MSILKRAIDTYNFFLDIGDKFKRMGAAPIAGTLALVLAGATLLAFQTGADVNGGASQADTAQTTQLAKKPEAAQQQGDVQEETRARSSTSQQAGSGDQAAGSSTAKPPATDKTTSSAGPQESFSHKISRPGQYAVGTLIAYDANKAAKTYYGGDLNLSRQTITISKADNSMAAKLLTVTTPDNEPVTEPHAAKDELVSTWFTVAIQNAGANAAAASFDLMLDKKADTPNGSYLLHIVANRTDAQTNVTWAYHGFITVNLTD